MSSVYESPWFLLAISAVLLGVALVIWQVRPLWGSRLILVPAVTVVLAFGLDLLVQTDSEQIHSILDLCRRAALAGQTGPIEPFIASDYRDPVHRSRAELLTAVESILCHAGLEKVVERGHRLRIEAETAQSQIRFRVHLSPQRSAYAAAGTLLFVVLQVDYHRDSVRGWQIQQVLLLSVNDSPMGWKDVQADSMKIKNRSVGCLFRPDIPGSGVCLCRHPGRTDEC